MIVILCGFLMSVLVLLLVFPSIYCQITPVPREITPIPRRNPREKEFQNLDSDNDGQVTFTEFLLSDKPYIEHASKNFYKFDDDGDSVITKEEFDNYYNRLDEERRNEEKKRQEYFNHFGRDRSPFSSPFFDFPIFHHLSSAPANDTAPNHDAASLLFS